MPILASLSKWLDGSNGAVIAIVVILCIAVMHDVLVGAFTEAPSNIDVDVDVEKPTGENDTTTPPPGVMIVAEGIPGQWNEQVRRWTDEIVLPVPTTIAFLEYAPYYTLERGLETLETEGVERVVVIPLFVCTNSSQTTELHRRLELLEPNAAVEIVCTTSMDADPLIAEALLEHGLELCEGNRFDPRDAAVDPEAATLVFYGRGDEGQWLEGCEAAAASLKAQIEANRSFEFGAVVACFMSQGHLRRVIEEATGHPVIVPWMVAWSSQSETDIRREVQDLLVKGECDYDGEHLIDHPNLAEWVEAQFQHHRSRIAWPTSA